MNTRTRRLIVSGLLILMLLVVIGAAVLQLL
jgi:hypothetical protein